VLHALLCCIFAATLGSSALPAEKSCGSGGIIRLSQAERGEVLSRGND